MPKYILPLFLVLSIMGAGCASSSAPAGQSANNQPTTGSGNTIAKTYTLNEVAQHATSTDCWMAISGKVYDVTSYIPNHPGGDKILDGCGKDATQMFDGIKGGQGHSDYAHSLLGDYYLGDLK